MAKHLARLGRGLTGVPRAPAESLGGIQSIVCTSARVARELSHRFDSCLNVCTQPYPSHQCTVAFLSPSLEHSRRGGSWRRLWFESSGMFTPFAFHFYFVHSSDGLVCFKFEVLSFISCIGISIRILLILFPPQGMNGFDGNALAIEEPS